MIYDLMQRRWIIGNPSRKIDLGALSGAVAISPDMGGMRVQFLAASFEAGCDPVFSAPAGAKVGDVLILKLTGLGAANSTTWNSVYKFAGGEPSWTVAGTDQVALVFDGAEWSESGLDNQGAV